MAHSERSLGQQTCDELADYTYFSANYPLNGQFVYNVTADLTWDVDMNAHGRIIVQSGRTLTIDGAVIEFGDSRWMDYRTAIIVQPGGHLVLQNGARLTSLGECPDSMWDGVMVMGVPTATEASGQQGTLVMRSAMIENAIVGVITGYCNDPIQWTTEPVTQTGGIVDCENAWFANNYFSVVLRPYNPAGNNGETATHFFGCSFLADKQLNPCPDADDVPPPPVLDCDDATTIMLYAAEVGHLRIGGCTFANSYGAWHYTDATLWGSAIMAYNTSISILPLCDGVYTGLEPCDLPSLRTENDFRGHFRAISIYNWSPDKYAEVVRTVISASIRGLHLQGVSHSTVIHNEFDAFADPLGLTVPRGLGLSNSTGFEIQENELNGLNDPDFGEQAVGMWFSNTGDALNTFYNNRFSDQFTTGTIIQGDNDGSAPDDGLEFKCNNWGYDDLPNLYDLAFTGSTVSVGNQQGNPGGQSGPAGNTFSPTCAVQEAHMWVEPGPFTPFFYWHHDPNSTSEAVRPDCRSIPPLYPDFFMDSNQPYGDGMVACESQTDLFVGDGGQPGVVVDADEQYHLLREVYDEVRDGGNTSGLKDYIDDPAHNSYDVRNQLMLVAPDVSSEVWEQVFGRDPAMNPWHLAQALLANVPLQPSVIQMMKNSGLDAYYQQLVEGAQGKGVSQLTIKESELAYWLHRRERALNGLTLYALRTGGATALHDALEVDEDHPQYGLPLNRLGLLMASGDLTGAKDIVDDLLLAAQPDPAMEVLGMYLDLKIADLTIFDVNTSDRARLLVIANTYGQGQGQAQAWLECLGEGPFRDELLLPDENRSMVVPDVKEEKQVELLEAFPNPNDGTQPLFLVVRMPEGMEQVMLRIVDPVGRLIREVRIAQKVTIVEVDARQLAKGMYLADLYADGVQVEKAKFEVTQ